MDLLVRNFRMLDALFTCVYLGPPLKQTPSQTLTTDFAESDSSSDIGDYEDTDVDEPHQSPIVVIPGGKIISPESPTAGKLLENLIPLLTYYA